jgi:hypothetical protein
VSGDEKIGKLARAVRIYRGAYDAKSGKWFRAPQPVGWRKVCVCLDRLEIRGQDMETAMILINAFKKTSEFQAWIRNLSNGGS